MKRILTILSLLAVALVWASAAESAASILQAMTRKLDGAGAVEAQFTLTGAGQRAEGSLIMDHGRFRLSTPGFGVWYDGTTQWTLINSSREVNITEPTLDELMESNPFVILNNWSRHYKALRLGDSQGRRRIQLTPLRPGDTQISKAVVFVATDNWPAAVEVTFADGSVIAVTIDHIASTAAKNIAFFRFDTAAYPAYEVVDLR